MTAFKDMIGIPWMLAFALRDTGWHLRNDIIWMKDNPIWIFQSTPPARGRLSKPQDRDKSLKISIHAPREGGDQ